jgi:hypothetical protein
MAQLEASTALQHSVAEWIRGLTTRSAGAVHHPREFCGTDAELDCVKAHVDGRGGRVARQGD